MMLSETLEFDDTSAPIPLTKEAIAAVLLIKLGSSCDRDKTAWLEAAQNSDKPQSILINSADFIPELRKS